jgi:hypothetical protein
VFLQHVWCRNWLKPEKNWMLFYQISSFAIDCTHTHTLSWKHMWHMMLYLSIFIRNMLLLLLLFGMQKFNFLCVFAQIFLFKKYATLKVVMLEHSHVIINVVWNAENACEENEREENENWDHKDIFSSFFLCSHHSTTFHIFPFIFLKSSTQFSTPACCYCLMCSLQQ